MLPRTLDKGRSQRERAVSAAVGLPGGVLPSGGGTGMTSERVGGDVRQVSASLITSEEIQAQSFTNAWQAVISLRPTWPKIPAWVGNGRIAFERLQEIPVANVKEIRLLSREQARVRFGPDAQQTILVVTR
jgi:hypothetical protein